MPSSPLFRTAAHCFRAILPVLVDLLGLAVIVGHSRRSLTAPPRRRQNELAKIAQDSGRHAATVLQGGKEEE
jgi:hypothetical protein